MISGIMSRPRYKYRFPDMLPVINVIVPARDEERVIGRCLDALVNQYYPRDKYRIIVVDGDSKDGTRDICIKYMARYPGLITLIKEDRPNGKPDALNTALKVVDGDIIAVFDADSIPYPDTLFKAASFFNANPGIAAIQGRASSVNHMKNVLTRIIYIEETAWFRLGLRGRDNLNLFVPLTGNAMFIRRDVLEDIGGWRSGELAEDVELSLRLFKNGYRVRYVDEISTLQEAPTSLSAFITQRYRWYRGYIGNMFRYGELVKNLSMKSIDAEALLVGPIIMALSVIAYLLSTIINSIGVSSLILSVSLSTLNILLLLTMITMYIALKPKSIRESLTVIAIIPYWMLQSLIAFKATVDTILRRKVRWMKTAKEGVI